MADNINTVNSIGDGYSIMMTLPYRMYSTQGYDVVFYRNEPTAFIHGESFTISRPLYFSSPISTNRISCLMTECNNVCNNSNVDTCLSVNRTMEVRIVNHLNTVYIAPEHNLEQDSVSAEVKPFGGYDMREDMKGVADNVTGYRSLVYLYVNDSSREAYLVFNHNFTGGTVKMTFNDTVGSLSVVESYDPGELSLEKGEWNYDGTDYDGGVIRLDSGGIHTCVKPELPGGVQLVWLNRGYEAVILQSDKEFCLTYP